MTAVAGPTGLPGTTWLITPATAPKRFCSARGCGADVAILDLEDSVPLHRKDQARAAALDYLTERARETAPETAREPAQETAPAAALMGLRLNAIGTLPGLRDLAAIAESAARPAILLIPKVESPRDIDLVAELTRPGGDAAPQNAPAIWALIETPLALQRLPDILAVQCLTGVVFGAADYAAAAGCRRTAGALGYPRAALAAAAAAASVPAIDSPCFDLDDPDELRREAEYAYELGFSGKGAIHPGQISVIQAAFRPSPHELARASAIVTAADSLGSEDTANAVTTVSGSMVGPPLIAAARALTDRALTDRPEADQADGADAPGMSGLTPAASAPSPSQEA